MTVDIQSEDGQLIRQLIPLSTLPSDIFESLCKKITIEQTKPNTFLFKKNDTTKDLIYLIEGSITLQSNDLKVETIESGSASARFALAHQIPRKIDAYTNTSVRFLIINFDIIENLPSSSYQEEKSDMFIDEPEDEIEEDDWMSTLLKSPIFSALPPANLQQILIGLEEVSYKKGAFIFKQDDPSDFYYVIKKGHCLLSRRPSANAKEIKLAQLRKRDTFGEDSILSGEPRNVTITTLTNTTILRLSKNKFISLIKEPTLKYINYSQIQPELDQGAILLDVRSADEFKSHHLPNCINAPFFSLGMQIKTFDKKQTILVVCANGKTSEAAAFLLLRQSFSALIIEGGMEEVAQGKKSSSTVNETDSSSSTKIENVVQKTPDIDSKKTTVNDKPQQAAELTPDLEQTVNSKTAEKIPQDTQLVENEQLQQTIETLTADKLDLEKKYRILYKQMEQLKSVLDKQKNAPSKRQS